ncbi:alpha/beta fold hydrolase [Candidatus Binatia bacterium]|jgi:pimeloyl-ACP methyl ester carboxylesterase|nr:alpha/beta fold hydrolase [Candidatus Binatia bacterium]
MIPRAAQTPASGVIVSESRKIDLGTHALRVREVGSGADAFVCLHGFLDDASVWSGVADALADAGRVVLVQQRGQGDSTAPEGPCSLDDLATDVVRMLDALGIERAVLVGHALGALVAAKAALAAPARVRGLVLVAPFSELDTRAAGEWRHVVRAGEVNKLQGLARAVFGPTSTRQIDGDGIALTEIARALHALGRAPVTPQLGAIACPTTVLVGESDAVGATAGRIVAGAIPGARLEVVSQQGADLHVRAADAVAGAARAVAR